jgi:predicted nucleic acid-binding protein
MSKAGNILVLDSSIIIEGFRQNPEVLATLTEAEILYLPTIAYGELYLGAIKSGNPDRKKEQLTLFLGTVRLLDVDWRTSHLYALIRKQLEQQGTPIPENDIWIAASAMQHEYRLYAKDQHFSKIEGLKIKSL